MSTLYNVDTFRYIDFPVLNMFALYQTLEQLRDVGVYG